MFNSISVTVGRTCLRISDVTAYHKGNYSCRARNGLGTVSHSAELVISSEWHAPLADRVEGRDGMRTVAGRRELGGGREVV